MKIYLQSQKRYRNIQEIYLSKKNLFVLAIRVFPKNIIPVENITFSPQSGLTAQTNNQLSSIPTDSITSKSLRHLPVFTASGTHLGKLQNLNYTKDLFQVSAIIVKPNFKNLLYRSNLIINRSAILNITKTKIIVTDSKSLLPNTADSIFSQLAQPLFPA